MSWRSGRLINKWISNSLIRSVIKVYAMSQVPVPNQWVYAMRGGEGRRYVNTLRQRPARWRLIKEGAEPGQRASGTAVGWLTDWGGRDGI